MSCHRGTLWKCGEVHGERPVLDELADFVDREPRSCSRAWQSYYLINLSVRKGGGKKGRQDSGGKRENTVVEKERKGCRAVTPITPATYKQSSRFSKR